MINTLDTQNVYFELILKFILVAMILQAVELLSLKKLWGKQGIFAKNYVPRFEYVLIGYIFSLIIFFIIGFHWTLIFPFLILVLFYYRFNGPLNGGSDYMTALVMLSCCIHAVLPNSLSVGKICLIYLGLQTVLSYFISGLVKVRSNKWRNGSALTLFLLESNYVVPLNAKLLVERPLVAKVASWVIIVFECTFPLVFISPRFVIFYLSVAMAFHVANFYLFGLNRFFWAWISAYPALIWAVRAFAN
jgi:hypothetical protein